MSNLLEETLEAMVGCAKEPSNIIYMGSSDGYSCTWEEFKNLANKEYDSGYGSHKVCDQFKIIFDDKSWLERAEYDGSEWWEYKKCPEIPDERKPIKDLFIGWDDFAESEENQ